MCRSRGGKEQLDGAVIVPVSFSPRGTQVGVSPLLFPSQSAFAHWDSAGGENSWVFTMLNLWENE